MATKPKNMKIEVLLYSHEESNDYFPEGGSFSVYKTASIECDPEWVCTAKLTQEHSNKTEIIKLPIFKLREIPDVMRKQGWTKAGEVQDAWFDGDAYEFTDDERMRKVAVPQKVIRSNLIDWTWLETFSRVKEKRSELINTSIYNKNAYNSLKKNMINAEQRGVFKTTSSVKVVFTPQTIQTVHENWQFQLIRIDDGFTEKPWTRDGTDDLFATLGSFTTYAAAKEMTVTRNEKNKTITIEVTQLAVYVMDTYDFHDAQYLGHWNREDMRIPFSGMWDGANKNEATNLSLVLVNKVSDLKAGKAFLPVNNSNYQAWREKHKKGGDMHILSDFKYYELPKGKLTFTIPIVTK